MRSPVDRTNTYQQADELYRSLEDRECDDLINNLVDALSGAIPAVQQKMVEPFCLCDEDYGRRVREGLEQYKREASQAGPEAGHQAVQQAKELSLEAQPY